MMTENNEALSCGKPPGETSTPKVRSLSEIVVSEHADEAADLIRRAWDHLDVLCGRDGDFPASDELVKELRSFVAMMDGREENEEE